MVIIKYRKHKHPFEPKKHEAPPSFLLPGITFQFLSTHTIRILSLSYCFYKTVEHHPSNNL